MANDNWRTPPEVFNTLNKEFVFLADTACTYENKLCPVGFTEENDSLAEPWLERLKNSYPYIGGNAYVFCNPPYSNPMPWVKHALKAQADGLGVVMLLNADHSVGWFAESLKGVSEIRNIVGDEKLKFICNEPYHNGYSSGRLAFINDEGKPVSGNNKPQFILVFNPFKIGAKVTTYINRNSFYKDLS